VNPSGETRELAHFSWLDVLLHTVRSLRNRVLYWSEPRHCSGRDSLLIATNTYGTYGVTLHVYRLRSSLLSIFLTQGTGISDPTTNA
jgi:hypothetical protein